MSVNEKRISEREAGYLELRGAKKDAECEVVEAEGGVSKDLGCCNSFRPASRDTEYFRCGDCFFLERDEPPEEEKPLGKEESRGMTFKDILESQRPVEETER